MNLFKIILKEILYRKTNSIIILFTVIISAALSIAIFTLSKASENETRKIMKEQGLNVYILPEGTDTLDVFTIDNKKTFNEEYIDRLATSKTFDAVRHLVGILQTKYDWKDPNGSVHKIILSGYRDETEQIHLKKQKTMGYNVKKGFVRLGYDISRNLPEKSLFQIKDSNGKVYKFEIAGRMKEGQGIRDKSVEMNLEDLQGFLGKKGQINKIEALGCTCEGDRLSNIRKQLASLLPDVEVKELSSIANARENQRQMMNRYGAFIIPFVILGCMLIAGLLFYANIKSRQYEIGILKSLGTGDKNIFLLITGKALVIGIIGAIVGFFIGFGIADYFGKNIFKFTGSKIKPVWDLLIMSLYISPLFLIVSSWIPAILATRLDPAEILKGE